MARGGKGGHTSHRQPSRPHAGDRRLAGLVHRGIRPTQVPTMGGAASIGRGGGGGGTVRAQKGIGLGDFLKARAAPGKIEKPTGRSSTPSERGDTLRQAVKREKAIRKTEKSLMKSDDRVFGHRKAKRLQRGLSEGGNPEIRPRALSKTQLRREGRLQRNLRGRLEEIEPIRRK